MNTENELTELLIQIEHLFLMPNWMDIGYQTSTFDVIYNQKNLLKNIDLKDNAYRTSIEEVLNKIRKRDRNNITIIKDYIRKTFDITESTPLIQLNTSRNEFDSKTPQNGVFNIANKPVNNKLVAVMFPFRLTQTLLAIRGACDSLNLECKNADDMWENQTFIQDIVDLIVTSRVIIADFSGKNPNVFYEVGIAHTLGKTVVPISQSLDDIPSDLKHHRVLIYLANEQGYKDLSAGLCKRLNTLIPVIPGS